MTAFDPIGRPLDEVLNQLAQQGRHPLIVQTRSPLSLQAQDSRSARVIAQRNDALVVAYFDMRSPESDNA